MTTIASKWVWQVADFPRFIIDRERVAPALLRARQAAGEIRGALGAVDQTIARQLALSSLSSEVIASSAIEGVTFDVSSVRSSAARRLGLPPEDNQRGNRSIDAAIEVLACAVEQFDQPIRTSTLLGWHRTYFPEGDGVLTAVSAGKLRRTTDDPMQIVSGLGTRQRVHYLAPPAREVRAMLNALLTWYNDDSLNTDGIERAAIVHAWFEIIHPFVDGNGRVGRTLVDHALARDAGSPERLVSVSAQLLANKDDYYRELERASIGLNLSAWIEWFANQVRDAYAASRQGLQASLDVAIFWAKRDHGRGLSERQHKALRALLDAGPGGFEGGMTTRKYVSLTRCSLPTASRDLSEMAQQVNDRPPLIAQIGLGRSTRYYPNIDGWIPQAAAAL